MPGTRGQRTTSFRKNAAVASAACAGVHGNHRRKSSKSLVVNNLSSNAHSGFNGNGSGSVRFAKTVSLRWLLPKIVGRVANLRRGCLPASLGHSKALVGRSHFHQRG